MAEIDIKEIIKRYGLEVEEIERGVYKVLNTDKEVNITKLQISLKQCFLLTPIQQKSKRRSDGYTEYYSKVYYIAIGTEYSLIGKYENLVDEDVIVINYDYTDYLDSYIGTLYEKEEIKHYG